MKFWYDNAAICPSFQHGLIFFSGLAGCHLRAKRKCPNMGTASEIGYSVRIWVQKLNFRHEIEKKSEYLLNTYVFSEELLEAISKKYF